MGNGLTINDINERVRDASEWVPRLEAEIGKVIIGQKYLIGRLIVGLIANGHVLLEGVPGLAKTLSVRTLASAIKAEFSRIQFTPDLLPADLIGTLIYNPREATFQTRRGPVFANIVLADEINRAPAKVQSALLEAMQERQVTIGDETHPLPRPFLVLATENPVDQEGTYPLPEAQVDRFMLKLQVDYPSALEERKILDAMASTQPVAEVSPVVDLDTIMETRRLIDALHMDEAIGDYIVSIVLATRDPASAGLKNLSALIRFGASPRATIALSMAARAWAFMNGRGYVVPQDVKDIGMDVLRHRIILSYEAEAEEVSTEDIVQQVFDAIPVP